MLSVKIQHSFPRFDLDIAFEAPAGVTALFGPSGAGKSTIVNAVAGLFKPDNARIDFDGSDLGQKPPHKRGMGLVFQDARLFPHMSVSENIDYGQRFAKKTPSANRAELVDLLDLGPLLTQRPATLSGGEAQRVAIARALLSAPRMLLMDEPLANLDAPRKADILPYLERLKQTSGLPVLYVSHAMAEVARLADHIVLLRAGKVVSAGPLFDVLSDPASIPLVGVREAGAVIPAKVVSHASDGLTCLQVAGGTLELPGVTAPPGSHIRLRVLASDIILSLKAPDQLSAMNALPVTITDILFGQGPGAAIALDASGDRLLVRVTSRTVERLGLRPGLSCFAILKSMAVAPAAIGHS